MARLKKGDKVKIFSRGFWLTTGKITSIKCPRGNRCRATVKYKDPDTGVMRTTQGPTDWIQKAKR